jgi:hypothetical protein
MEPPVLSEWSAEVIKRASLVADDVLSQAVRQLDMVDAGDIQAGQPLETPSPPSNIATLGSKTPPTSLASELDHESRPQYENQQEQSVAPESVDGGEQRGTGLDREDGRTGV